MDAPARIGRLDGARLQLRLMTLALALLALPAAASGLSISPTSMRFPAGGPRVQVVQISNHESTTVSYELDVRVEPAGAEGQDAKDVVVSPSLLTLQPGEQARVRVGLAHLPPADRERGYRLYVTQLPPPAADTAAGTVGVLMRVGIPLFVDAPGMRTLPVRWTARRDGTSVVLTATNPGTRHVRVDRAEIREGGRIDPLMLAFRYLYPGQSVDIVVDATRVDAPDVRIVLGTPDGEQSVALSVP